MKNFFGKSKKTILFFLIMMLFLQTGCSLFQKKDTSDSDGDVIELKLAHFFPATHPVESELIAAWKEEVEKATNGQVKVTTYPGESLLKAPDIYEGVVRGTSELGVSCFSYTPGRFRVLEVFELPGITYNNSKAASMAAWEGIKELNPEEVQDTKLMMVLATGPGDLFTTVPVKNYQDLQGLDIRATGISSRTLSELGANPIGMPQSEVYDALSKGVVKGNLAPIEVLQGWRHAEVTKYITKTPFLYNTLFFFTMNKEVWESLPINIQNTIQEVNEKIHEEVAIGLWDKQNNSALEWATKEKGMEIILLEDNEINLWVSIVQHIQEEYVELMEIDEFEGQKIMDTAVELAEKNNNKYKR